MPLQFLQEFAVFLQQIAHDLAEFRSERVDVGQKDSLQQFGVIKQRPLHYKLLLFLLLGLACIDSYIDHDAQQFLSIFTVNILETVMFQLKDRPVATRLSVWPVIRLLLKLP